MEQQNIQHHLPDAERVSIVAATILLAYTLARYINLPGQEVSIQLPGVSLNLTFNIQALVALLVAGLSASGANWLFCEHPLLGNKNPMEHWILPAMTTLVIALPLFQVPQQLLWWVGFAMGGGFIVLVLIAEYIVIDPHDLRYPPAAAGITAISFALFLILTAALNYAETRLFLLLPALTIACMLVCLRVLRLRISNRWLIVETIIISLITIQIASALHYWPISPVAYGLAILAPTYALTNLIGSLVDRGPKFNAIFEPFIILIIIWTMAFWLR
jgi:hypothetical protein